MNEFLAQLGGRIDAYGGRFAHAHRKLLDDCFASYRSKLDEVPVDEEQRWHRAGQGYVWFKVIMTLAEAYDMTLPGGRSLDFGLRDGEDRT